MTALVIQGDAASLPLPDGSVDLVVTSPPYFALRSYQDGGQHYAGQVGSEPTPAEFLEALWACTAEWMRVLKPSGSIFVNLGDKYAGQSGEGDRQFTGQGARDGNRRSRPGRVAGIPPKSLMGLPWRYAIGCVDRLGLILRAEIIWDKPNGLPESVTDRVRRSHENWFHFTLNPRYFSAVDEIRSGADSHPSRRALLAPARRSALGPELRTTVRTDNGPAVARAWCQLGSLEQSVCASVTGDAEGFQVARLVGFHMGVETAERNYVVDLQPFGSATLDAGMAVAVKDALAYLAPGWSAPSDVATRPSGVLLSGVVLDNAWSRAEVDCLDCVPIAAEGLAARLTLNLDPGQATLLIWNAFSSTHEQILPQQNTLGKLPGSVWSIPSEPLTVPEHLGVNHFAAFPTEWPRRIIQGWSPSGICTGCGEGRRPLIGTDSGRKERTTPRYDPAPAANFARHGWNGSTLGSRGPSATITGYACGCDPTESVIMPTTPAVVVDPFGGTGTTALCASVLGRIGITVDLSHDYSRLAAWRTTDPAMRAKAMRVDKPPIQLDGQTDLFGSVA